MLIPSSISLGCGVPRLILCLVFASQAAGRYALSHHSTGAAQKAAQAAQFKR